VNKTLRGLLVLVGMIAFGAFFCLWLPFILLPGAGIGVALPVIYVPGEILIKDFLGEGVHLTNTLVGMVLADVVILIILLFLYLGGGVKAVPNRLQGVLELLVGFMYDFAKSVAGSRAGRIFPLVMTIFLFLLIANWLALVPGVDSVGLIHCAEDGFTGYPVNVEEGEPIEGLVTLRNVNPLYAGERADEANFCACEALHLGHFPKGEEAHCEAVLAEAGIVAHGLDGAHEEDTHAEDADEHEDDAHTDDGYHHVSDELVAAVVTANTRFDDLVTVRDELTTAQTELADAQAALTTAEGAEHEDAAEHDEAQTHLDEAQARVDALQAQVAELEVGAVDADIFVVTPFVRAATTDLNLTIMLAIIAVIMVQVYGVWSLGPDYFQKFVNLRALGNLGKNPLGLVDFVVGIFEIVSEFAKIISFAFRLFGNLFAGQVLLFIMAFLVATMLPVVFYALKLFVGLMQAFVFAVLTLIFSAQAMESHHHDDDH
jgi:F0F1-type ATP synthase membrane subunit a